MRSFTDSTDAMQASIRGFGAILARSRIVEPYIRDGRLVRLPGPLVKARYGYYVVYPSHRRLTTATTSVIEWLRREAEQDTEYLPTEFDAASPSAIAHTQAHPLVGATRVRR
jgi:DNA-binding transcriptional LysR family regulator